MSKRQGDGYRTETNHELNRYYDEVFLPAVIKMEDEKIKEFHINGGLIICEQKNIVEWTDGWKLKGLKVIGREYIVRVFSNENDLSWADVTEDFKDKDKANECFKFWKTQLEM